MSERRTGPITPGVAFVTGGARASKHAVLGMTKTIALEVRDQGIRVNCVSPGFFLVSSSRKISVHSSFVLFIRQSQSQ